MMLRLLVRAMVKATGARGPSAEQLDGDVAAVVELLRDDDFTDEGEVREHEAMAQISLHCDPLDTCNDRHQPVVVVFPYWPSSSRRVTERNALPPSLPPEPGLGDHSSVAPAV
jgi:hypothetical protein